MHKIAFLLAILLGMGLAACAERHCRWDAPCVAVRTAWVPVTAPIEALP